MQLSRVMEESGKLKICYNEKVSVQVSIVADTNTPIHYVTATMQGAQYS